MTFAQRWHDVAPGFERPFWVARLSYYAGVCASLPARSMRRHLPIEQTGALNRTFWWAGMVPAGLRRNAGRSNGLSPRVSLAYLIPELRLFPAGIASRAVAGANPKQRAAGGTGDVCTCSAALGVALVKPSVVGATARASKENIRSIGYSIYYTLVNVAGFSYVHQHMSVEDVSASLRSAFSSLVGSAVFP